MVFDERDFGVIVQPACSGQLAVQAGDGARAIAAPWHYMLVALHIKSVGKVVEPPLGFQ